MTARRAPRPLAGDEAGAFPVFEAILVAVLVLTAILFFTSVQRPTTGTGEGGIDLGQISADTLRILQVRTFTVATGSPHAGTLSFDQWAANLAAGDAATAAVVDDFLSEVLPTGSRYSLRLDNGVSTLTLLPLGVSEEPHGARAGQVLFLPNWATHKDDAAALTVFPGQVVPSAQATLYPLVEPGSPTYQCYQAPNGQSRLRDGPDDGSERDHWRGHWQATPNATTPWKASAGTGAYQVPTDALLGKWKLWSGADCTGTATVLDVVRPECAATPAPTGCSSPYLPYALQMVVWFGA